MKKIIILALPVILVFSSIAYALDMSSSGPTGGQMGMYPPAITKDKIEKSMRTLIEVTLLYKMLSQPTMVAVDGGIIVGYGNSLIKYDKDLNVVKQVDLNLNVDSMQALASKLAQKYSSDVMDMMGGAGESASGFSGGPSPAYTQLLNARMTSNDALAKATLRAISTAAESYATANNGNYPENEAALTGATPPYLNTAYCANSPIAGYFYDCKGMSTTGYTITATPMTTGTTGTTMETITTGGVLTP